MGFAEDIKKLRLSAIMTQEDFAKELGVSFATVNRWETGKAKPTIKAMKLIVSRYLNSLNQQMIGLEAYIEEISEQIRPQLDEIVSEYGLRCPKFSLVSLEVDTGNYEKINDFQLDAI